MERKTKKKNGIVATNNNQSEYEKKNEMQIKTKQEKSTERNTAKI